MNNHRVIANIDLSALQHNISLIKKNAPRCSILAMVKSNAYGHGAVEVVKFLQNQVEAFGVACLDEAMRLHDAGIKKPIVIMMGFLDADELQLIARCGFEPVIHNHVQLDILEKAHIANKINVWLKIDTGMHRLGFQPIDAEKVYLRLWKSGRVIQPPRVFTHFSDADDVDNPKTEAQCKIYSKVTAKFKCEKSLANSPAILLHKNARLGWIRPGGIMYGISVLKDKDALALGFKPVMTLTSRLTAIHSLEKGDTVGYGSSWSCPEPMRIGIVSVGYGDGYARSAKVGAPILINGINCPLIGRVAMDMLTVDLRKNQNAQIGDTVVLWGKELPIETVAAYADTIPYELICRLTSRVYHQFFYE